MAGMGMQGSRGVVERGGGARVAHAGNLPDQ